MEDGLNLFLLGKKLPMREGTLGWLRDIGLIQSSRYCKKKKSSMTLMIVASRGTFRTLRCCTKKQIHEASVAENTWFN